MIRYMVLDYIMSLHVCMCVSNSNFKYGCINWNICIFTRWWEIYYQNWLRIRTNKRQKTEDTANESYNTALKKRCWCGKGSFCPIMCTMGLQTPHGHILSSWPTVSYLIDMRTWLNESYNIWKTLIVYGKRFHDMKMNTLFFSVMVRKL